MYLLHLYSNFTRVMHTHQPFHTPLYIYRIQQLMKSVHVMLTYLALIPIPLK